MFLVVGIVIELRPPLENELRNIDGFILLGVTLTSSIVAASDPSLLPHF